MYSLGRISIINHKQLHPLDGGTLRVGNIVNGLVRRGRDVFLAYWSDRAIERVGSQIGFGVTKPRLRALKILGRILYGSKEGENAVDLLLCNFPRILTKLRCYLRTSSVVQSEQIWSALFPLLYRRFLNKVSVLDDHNVEAVFASRLSRYAENKVVYAYWLRYVTALERVCCRLANVVVVTSEKDKEDLARVHAISKKKIIVIPNGVDLEKYKPDPQLGSKTRRRLGIPEKDPVLVFVGRASYPPNKLAIDYIKNHLSQAVWRKHPTTRFIIVSRELPQKYLESADPRIIQISQDSDDLPYVNAADIGLAPLSVGGGTRLKIMNYMACGKPVITTPTGCEGIPFTEKDIVVSSLDEFPEFTNMIIDNSHLRAELGQTALQKAQREFSWDKSIAKFDQLYDDLCTKNGN